MRRKMLSGIALLGMLAMLVGGNQASAQDPLVIIQGAEPPGLDPTIHREGPTYSVTINIFDSLLRKTRDGQNVPALAESFERDTDTSWVFHLRPGVQFHNGEPLTAAAVKFTIDRIFGPDLESTRASDFKWIDRVEIVDELTVRIVAKEPFALADHFFTELQIVPPSHFTGLEMWPLTRCQWGPARSSLCVGIVAIRSCCNGMTTTGMVQLRWMRWCSVSSVLRRAG